MSITTDVMPDNFTRIVTRRDDSHSVTGAWLGAGVEAIRVPHPTAVNKFGYITEAELTRETDPETVRGYGVVGNISDDGLLYQCVIKCDAQTRMRIAPNAVFSNKYRIAPWALIEGGICSPLHGDMRALHARIRHFARMMERATVTVTIYDRDGHTLETVTVRWANRDERGRFITAEAAAARKNGGWDMLTAIDKAAEPHRIKWQKRIRIKTSRD